MLLLMVKLLWSDRQVTQLSRVVVERAGGDVEARATQWWTFCLHQCRQLRIWREFFPNQTKQGLPQA
jgi:hypothetical protein